MKKAQKHIAVLCDYRLLPERVGGMDHFFWRFDAECKSKGIAIDWFFPNKENHGEYEKLRIIPAEGKSVESSFLYYFQHDKPLYSHLITHFLEICTPFFKKVKQQTTVKIIAVDHNPRPLYGYPLKKKILKRVKGLMCSKYIDLFVGVSQYTVNELIRDFGQQIKPKCQVIYNGILLENIKVRQSRKTKNPTFLVASHLRQSKGIQDLIQAVAQLPVEVKNNLRIDVYGDGPYRKNLVAQTKDLSVEQNFNFKGSSSNLANIFCQYDYLLHPTYMECFSLTLLESLAANVPVITTPVGGNTEVVSNDVNGYIFETKDVEALKNCIEELWKGSKSVPENTRPFIAHNFGLDQMLEKHIALVE